MASTDTESSWRFACLMIACAPILMVVGAHEKLKERAQRLEPLEALPLIRKRALSFQSSGLPKTSKSIFHRNSKPTPCFFLNKLPLEIRTMIYVEVLGGHVFRIERRKKNLGHITCHHVSGAPCCIGRGTVECSMYGAVGGLWPPKKKWNRAERDPHAELLGLVKTCRTIYRESIEVLYAHNSFHIASFSNLVGFQSTVLPQRLRSLRHLNVMILCEDIRYNSAAWESIWGQLAKNKGLETLKIVIDGRLALAPYDASEERAWMAPLMEIETKRSFKVQPCWLPVREYANAPFTISPVPDMSLSSW